MGSPLPDVLLIALRPLSQSSWAGRIPDPVVGQPFWASARDAAWLVPDGYAEIAPEGTIAPPPEPAFTVHGTPGFAAGTSNSSH